MLINKETAEAWFAKDSFIYKQYIFLYRNPAWQSKRLPSGASLCPYFWQAMFALIFLKPLIYSVLGLIKCIKPLINLGGKPVNALDKFVRSKVFTDTTSSSGMGIAVTLLGAVLLCIMSRVAYLSWFAISDIYAAAASIGSIGIWSFWGVIFTWVVAAPVALYGHLNRYDSTRCKAEVYLWIWAAGFLAATSIVYPSATFGGVKTLLTGLFVVPVKLLWAGACYLVVNGWELICVLATTAWQFIAVPVAKFFWFALTFCFHPFGIPVPWWLMIALALAASAGFGLLIDKIAHWNGTNGKASYRASWRHLLQSFFRHEEQSFWRRQFRERVYEYDNTNISHTLDRMSIRYLIDDIVNVYLDEVFKKNLDALDSKPVPVMSWMTPWKKGNYTELNILTGIDNWENIVHLQKLKTAYYNWIPKFVKTEQYTALCTAAIAGFKRREEALAETQRLRAIAPSRLLCKAITSSIDTKVSAVANALTTKIAAVYRQVKIGLSYATELAKAKKQGACPYMRFSETQDAYKVSGTEHNMASMAGNSDEVTSIIKAKNNGA